MDLFDLVKRATLTLLNVTDGTAIRQLIVDSYNRLRTAVVDEELALVSAGNLDCSSAAQLSAQTTPAYLIIRNLDASATVYIGASGVTGSTNGIALASGDPALCFRASNPSLWYGIGSSTVNVGVLR